MQPRADRKAVAQQTLQILRQGGYHFQGRWVAIADAHARSVGASRLYRPGECPPFAPVPGAAAPAVRVVNAATVQAICELTQADPTRPVAALNFASAKNPGGGFLSGAMAQEESLAASSGLYDTLLAHPAYYEANRACGTMCYTDHAIYSPGVVFLRDARFALLPEPVLANLLTLPAVNYGQVLQKGEDAAHAAQVMARRMHRALALFAGRGDRRLVLGAYGCGVFRNDPAQVAAWWQELLAGPDFAGCFDEVVFAVLDRSPAGRQIAPFLERFGAGAPAGGGDVDAAK